MTESGSDPIVHRLTRATVLVCSAVLVAFALGCASAGPPLPQAGYHARVHVAMQDAASKRIERLEFAEDYADGKRRRVSIGEADAPVVIERSDLRVAWRLDPRAHSLVERPLSEQETSAEAIPDPFRWQGSARFSWVTTETFEGMRADRYRVSGGGFSGTAWLALDRIPLRFEGTVAREQRAVALDIRYREIRRARRSAALFEIPASYPGSEKQKRKLREHQESVDNAVRIMREQITTHPTRMPASNPMPGF